MSEQREVPPFEQVHETQLASAAEHLENSRRLSAQAHHGWERTPSYLEADDAHHHGMSEHGTSEVSDHP